MLSDKLSMMSDKSGTACCISLTLLSDGGWGFTRRRSVVVSVQSDLNVRSVYPADMGIDLLVIALLHMYCAVSLYGENSHIVFRLLVYMYCWLIGLNILAVS